MRRLPTAALLLLWTSPAFAAWDASLKTQDPQTTAPPDWRLSAEPVAVIGMTAGPEAYELSLVSSAFRLSDGTIVIASAGTSDLRFYDSTGAHERTVGRRGDGPGEFRQLRSARAIRGDTIMTWDPIQQRVSFFTPSGDFVDDLRPDFSTMGNVRVDDRAVPIRPATVHLLGNGGGVAAPSLPTSVMTRGPNGVRRDSTELFVFDRTGKIVARVGPIAAGETFVHDSSSIGLFFGHDLMIAGGRDHFYVGTGKPYAIRPLASGGAARRTIAVRKAATPVTQQAIQEVKERFLARIWGGANESHREFVNAMPMPDTMPSYSWLLTDREGNLWVQEYEWRRDRPRVWAAFTPDGELLGRLTVPAGLKVMQPGRDYLVALHRDELDVERIEVSRVERVKG